MCFSDLRAREKLTNPGKKDVPLIVGPKNAEFMGHEEEIPR